MKDNLGIPIHYWRITELEGILRDFTPGVLKIYRYTTQA